MGSMTIPTRTLMANSSYKIGEDLTRRSELARELFVATLKSSRASSLLQVLKGFEKWRQSGAERGPGQGKTTSPPAARAVR